MQELAERMTADYRKQLERLGVDSIDYFPKATEHIDDIQRMITGLIDKGFAYAAGGDVYFDVAKDEDYGKLCNRDPEQLEAAPASKLAKETQPGRFRPLEGAKPGEPKWDSPWGPGRPGWHIECSAMSMKLLGKRSTSTAAGSICSFRTTKTNWPSPSRILIRLSPASGCTTDRSKSAPARCPRARGTKSSSKTCSNATAGNAAFLLAGFPLSPAD